MTIRATTAPGIEDIASDEGIRLLTEGGFNARPARVGTESRIDLPGVVIWTVDPVDPVTAFREIRDTAPFAAARSLFHVAVHVAEIEWDGVSLESLLRGIGITDFTEMPEAASFRVSCTRVGDHPFSSPEVEREAGAILQERYGTAVDLEGYALHVKVDIVGSRAFCGYQLTGRKGLDRRYRWIYHPRVTLRTPIAYSMLVIAGYDRHPGALHDPFCGSGTILLEAAAIASRHPACDVRLSGSDRDPRAVDGATSNLQAAGLTGTAVSQVDARELSLTIPESSLDYIVTNPPFGIKIAKGQSLYGLYRDFLAAAIHVLRPGGTLALLVGRRRGEFNRVLRGVPDLALQHVRIIEMGGVFAALFVLRKAVRE
jgi:tRNA (guanine6-N2)-methyltransferase